MAIPPELNRNGSSTMNVWICLRGYGGANRRDQSPGREVSGATTQTPMMSEQWWDGARKKSGQGGFSSYKCGWTTHVVSRATLDSPHGSWRSGWAEKLSVELPLRGPSFLGGSGRSAARRRVRRAGGFRRASPRQKQTGFPDSPASAVGRGIRPCSPGLTSRPPPPRWEQRPCRPVRPRRRS